MKACTACGRKITSGSRCAAHRLPPRRRDRAFRAEVAALLAASTRCGICGEPFGPRERRVADHIVPRSRGGADAIENIQAAHAACNAAKGATIVNGGAL